jgi:hypothetical protein
MYQDVPTTQEYTRQRITNECAAINPQIIGRLSHSSNDTNSALQITVNNSRAFVNLFVGSKCQDKFMLTFHKFDFSLNIVAFHCNENGAP